MPYAENHGMRIHYEVEGVGSPIVLQHGITDGLESWYDYGFVDALRDEHTLILIDARGHGGSDKPHDPAAYRLDRLAGDVVAVLDELGYSVAHFWGYSTGGRIGFGMAKHARARVNCMVIGGMHPYARNMEPFRQLFRKGIAEGGDAFVAAVEGAYGAIPPGLRARQLAADFCALLAIA